jgi:hypothetical protein
MHNCFYGKKVTSSGDKFAGDRYGPQLGGSLIRGIQANGGLVTRDAQLLIDVVAP